jgi:hypothetical protein
LSIPREEFSIKYFFVKHILDNFACLLQGAQGQHSKMTTPRTMAVRIHFPV